MAIHRMPRGSVAARLLSAFQAMLRGELGLENLLSLCDNLKMLEEATEADCLQLSEVLNDLRQNDDSRLMPLCYLVLAFQESLVEQRRFSLSLSLTDGCVSLLRDVGSLEELARCQALRASALRSLGSFSRALTYYDEALLLLRNLGVNKGVGTYEMNRANLLLDLGFRSRALAGFEVAIPLLQDDGCLAEVGTCLMNRANALWALNHHPDRLIKFSEALLSLREHGLPADVGRCLSNQASALNDLGRHSESLKCNTEAIHILREHAPSEVDACLMNQANTLYEMSLYQQAVDVIETIDVSHLNLDCRCIYHTNFGEILWKKNQKNDALIHYEEGRKSMRIARRMAGIDETNLQYIRERLGFINLCVERTLSVNRSDEAFAAVQDGKATILGDRLDAVDHPVEPPEVWQARRKVVDLFRSPAATPASGDEETPSVKATPDACLKDYLRTWGMARYPKHHPLPGLAEDIVVSQREIQDALAPGWAIIDFWRTKQEEFTAFVLTRDALQVVPLPFPIGKDEELKQHLDELRYSMAHLKFAPREAVLDDLRIYLFDPLEPILKQANIKGLYLVPHDLLHGLPLHAARYHSNGQPVYLCDEYQVAYLPAAALLPRLPKLDRAGAALSLVNPERGRAKHTLPFAEWEGTQMRTQFPNGRSFAGPEATYARTAEWRDAGLVHFSCHGQGMTRFAALSHLRLADDLLLAHDVLYRRPPLRDGALVVLNGCQTSVADWGAVDEGMGLMSAFLQRGAGLVFSTQWSVLDTCAAELSLAFLHGYYQENRSPADALRRAQQHVRELTPAQMNARYREVLAMFPEKEHPVEHRLLLCEKTRTARSAGETAEAQDDAEKAAFLYRQAGQVEMADRLLAYARSTSEQHYVIKDFRSPLHWSAFQLIGRVV